MQCMFYLLGLAVILSVIVWADAQKQQPRDRLDPLCSDTQRHEIEKHLSTKTPYRVVANYDDNPIKYSGCQPKRIWSVIRHGSRNPSSEIISQAQDKLEKLKNKILKKTNNLCSTDLDRLHQWHFNVSINENKYLVAEGEDELIELAERMQKRFPTLLSETYDPSLYYFKYTATQRTLKSAESFTTGLFGRHHIADVKFPEALHKDPILRFYKLCDRWKTDVDKNPQTFDNVRRFLEGPEMRAAISYIQSKTQVEKITAERAQLIYTICAFETAWHRRREPSVWCNLFDRETIKVLEFAEDLEYYWNDGYGYEITQKIACPAIADMFEYIDPKSTKPNATFYFTHSGTVLKILAHLGLYKDAAALTFADYKKPRFWHTSEIDSFASNIAFVLYECENATPMVLILHQERAVHIAGCPTDSDLCSLQTLRKIFDRSLEHCNFDEICYA